MHSSVQPIPPANSVGGSVRALTVILAQLGGESALRALRAGDACANVDKALWAPAWEGARNFRDHFLLSLARHTRDEWRRDVRVAMESVASTPDAEQARTDIIVQALEERLRVTLDFAFQYLTPRHVCFLADALALAFEADIPTSDFARELSTAAGHSPFLTPGALEAVVVGCTGMHRHEPERVMSTSGIDAFGGSFT